MLNKMKLAPKLALVIGSVLSLVLIVLISITAVMSKSAHLCFYIQRAGRYFGNQRAGNPTDF